MSDIALHQRTLGRRNLYIEVLQLLRDAVSSAVVVKLNQLRLLIMNYLSCQHCEEMSDQASQWKSRSRVTAGIKIIEVEMALHSAFLMKNDVWTRATRDTDAGLCEIMCVALTVYKEQGTPPSAKSLAKLFFTLESGTLSTCRNNFVAERSLRRRYGQLKVYEQPLRPCIQQAAIGARAHSKMCWPRLGKRSLKASRSSHVAQILAMYLSVTHVVVQVSHLIVSDLHQSMKPSERNATTSIPACLSITWQSIAQFSHFRRLQAFRAAWREQKQIRSIE